MTIREHRNKRFGFLHIPRTGGSSFESMLRGRFPEGFAVRSLQEYYAFPELVRETRIVAGHIPHFLFAQETLPRTIFTIVRSPIARVTSNYRYIYTAPAHYGHELVTRYRLSLAECLEHPALRFDMSNLQTRMLGWRPPSASRPAATEPQDPWGRFHEDCADYFNSRVDEPCYARALDVLRNHASFGFFEELETTIGGFYEILGVRYQPPLLHINQSSEAAHPIGERDLEAITRCNGFDLCLYEGAKRIAGRPEMQELPRRKIAGGSGVRVAFSPWRRIRRLVRGRDVSLPLRVFRGK